MQAVTVPGVGKLAGKRVTVMGLGLHGGAVGTIQWLHQQGAKILVTDLKNENELASSLAQLQHLRDITYVLGQHRDEDFTNTDLVIRNPGVPRTSPYVDRARRSHVPIEMDSSLFFLACPSNNIIGITGSKGKSTTTHAIFHLLQLKYPNTVTVGIDQASPLGKLESVTPDTLVIFELSSWRLEALERHKISPQTAIVTSIYEDHLNTYASFAEYQNTKKIIFRFQNRRDRVLLNADDAIVRTWEPATHGDLYWYSITDKLPGSGICVNRDGIIEVRAPRFIKPMELFPLSTLKLEHEHEQRNVLPAILLGFMGGIPPKSIQLNVANLRGLAHRLERMGAIGGVTYINDSAATMPDATIAALKALKNKHIVLICGGSDKKLRFEKFATACCDSRIRAFILLPGTATARIRDTLLGAFGTPPPIYNNIRNMEDAVRRAAQVAQPGDVVLLSPGATSFGLFKHEFDRGDKFKEAVRHLV